MPLRALTPLRRLTCLAALAAGLAVAAPAAASSWPAAGGGPGNPGLQPVDPGDAPFNSAYWSNSPNDEWIMTSPVVTPGHPTAQRVAYGTLNGSVHLQNLLTGAAVGTQAGVNVDDATVNDLDVFSGENGGSVSPVVLEHAGGTRLLVLHNDDDQGGGSADIALAQVNAATGAVISDTSLPGSEWLTVSSTPVLSDPDPSGNRYLMFTAGNGSPGQNELWQVQITGATGSNPTVGAAADVGVPELNLLASPAIVYLNDGVGNPTQYAMVSTGSGVYAAVRSYEVGNLAAGPASNYLGGAVGTPSVPLTSGGLNPGSPGSGMATTPAVYISVGGSSTSTVHRLVQSGSSQALTESAGPTLDGTPSHNGMAITQRATSATTYGPGRLVVSTHTNLFVLDAETLSLVATHSGSALTPGSTGFARTAPTVGGSNIYISRDNGHSLVLALSNAQPLPAGFSEQAGNATATTAHGRPAAARWFALFVSDKGMFAYRTQDESAPTVSLTAPQNGVTVAGSIQLGALAGDERGIQSVIFEIDGNPVGTVTTPASGDPYDPAGAAYATSLATTTLSAGSHTLEAIATDGGNQSTTSAARTFIVDNNPPQTTINSGPPAVTNVANPSFTFSSSEAGTFQCRIDSGAFAPCSSPYSPGSLAAGSHTFEVRAIDSVANVDPTPASRSFTIDTTAPQTTVDSGPSGPTGLSNPSFAFSSSEAGSTFECRVDGGAWSACTSPRSTGVLADGPHTFDVRATDAAGNLDATHASRSFTVDTTAPQTTIDSGPSGATGQSNPSFGFSSSEAGSTFECRVDGGAWSACTSPRSTGVLADGNHTFDVRATDGVGNVDASPATRSILVDSTAPQTTINGGPSGATGQSNPSFPFSSSEAGSTFECRVDGGAWVACTSPHSTGTLADGSHTFEVRATDSVANVDATPASRSFTVDTTSPQTTIDSGPAAASSQTSPSFVFSSSESGSTFQCRMDGGAWGACTSPHSPGTLADGNHTFDVRATDGVGNVDATPAARSFLIDSAAPQTTIDSGPPSASSQTNPAFQFSSSESGSTFQCRVDGGSWTACTSPRSTGALADGNHTFDVRATDGVGNVDATPATRSFLIDSAAPQTTIDSGPPAASSQANPTFQFSSSESGSSFECRMDGGSWAACTSPYSPGTVTDGDHVFNVRATDGVGNVDTTEAVRAFTVDATTPETFIDGAPPLGAKASHSFEFHASEAGSTFECRVDGGAWESCTSPYSPGVADGDHVFDVRATDAFGNVDPTEASRAFSVDNSTPETTIDSGPEPMTSQADPSFEFSSSKSGFIFECRIDGGGWDTCSSPHTTGTLGDGDHLFEVRAVDSVGHADPTAASRSFHVDTTAPETTIDSGPAPLGADASPTFDFSANEGGSTFECRMDGGAWEACTSPLSPGSVADGDHVFDVRGTDALGNADATAASLAFSVDTTAPETTIDAGPEPVTPDVAPSFEFSASEPGAVFECRIDDGPWAACVSPLDLAELPAGDHVFDVQATDGLGNLDASPASLSFRIELPIEEAAPIRLLDRELPLAADGRVKIPVKCPQTEALAECDGIMSFFVTYHPPHKHSHAGHDHGRAHQRVSYRHQRRTRRVRKRRFDLAPGERKTLPVQLGDFTRTLACRRGGLNVKVLQWREVDGVWVSTPSKLELEPKGCPDEG